ncbi:lectin-like domain-containing protein [Carnobacterium maltaromaticum]|uniref:lectin-like domain-containing protein n=1 Tax=Carnobacterium maltaromaticum TaxID=2751 RepID=UPI0039B03060
MRKKQILLAFWSIALLIFIFNPSVKASSLPPSSVPIDNVFAVPSGANSYTDGNITVITSDNTNRVGSIFSTDISPTKTNKIDMSKSFHSEMYVYLGDKRFAAADGMAFVMHADKESTERFEGGVGDQLGVYAKYDAPMTQQIKNSFAIEFDTYYNGDSLDKNVSQNDDKGHIAYSFPDKASSYDTTLAGIGALKHQGLYYPKDYLSNGTWHTFSVDWNPLFRVLTYKFDDAPAVRVSMNPTSVFGTNSVYWGFTGSTGAKSQESKVAFKQIPGLVNMESSMKVTKDGKDITNTGVSAADGDVKLEYASTYNGGKQDLINPVFSLELDDYLSYKKGSLVINGQSIPDLFLGGKLTYKLPLNMTSQNNKFSVSFEATPKVVTSQNVKSKIKYSLTADNYIDNSEVEMPIQKVKVITNADFENQSWLINTINTQLFPKKIGIDVYESDLDQIVMITPLEKGYPTEHIPASINKLKNLETLDLENMKLKGSLPQELGELSKLKGLIIIGNNIEGGIPSSLGNLTNLQSLALTNNQLTGPIPATLGLLNNLKQVDLSKNKLSGSIPDFPSNMEWLALSDNQVTYNSAVVPDFLKNAKFKSYDNTFIQGLKVTGNTKIASTSSVIKPFNLLDSGYFNLKVLQGNVTQELYDEHQYTIKNSVDGAVLYKGKKDTQVQIPYYKGISYTVSVDDAEKNPNSVLIISGKVDEFKFEETPKSMSIKAKIGDEEQPVTLDGQLAIFDNRENANWKLSITPSNLKQGTKTLQGEYTYTDKGGETHSIINGKKYLLEKGKSDSINEVINLSNSWGNKQGLHYKMNKSNYVGEYKGSVNWTLEDAP